MGQYFKVYYASDKGPISVFNPGVKNGKEVQIEGDKLLEHSEWDNPFCMAISELLTKEKAYVVWCGDYCEESEARKVGFHKCSVWRERDFGKYPKAADPYLDLSRFCLVNHTKQQYVDFKKYYENFNKLEKEYEGKDETVTCLHPLPLLTVLGNGISGGDYSSSMLNYNMVGNWAGDLISVDYPISGYKVIDTLFVVRSIRKGCYVSSMEYQAKISKLREGVQRILDKSSENNDYNNAVAQYAYELIGDLEQIGSERRVSEDTFTNERAFEKFLLRGAKDWNEYSCKGYSLSCPEDIAERVGFDWQTWLFTQQAFALMDAVAMLKRLLFG